MVDMITRLPCDHKAITTDRVANIACRAGGSGLKTIKPQSSLQLAIVFLDISSSCCYKYVLGILTCGHPNRSNHSFLQGFHLFSPAWCGSRAKMTWSFDAVPTLEFSAHHFTSACSSFFRVRFTAIYCAVFLDHKTEVSTRFQCATATTAISRGCIAIITLQTSS